MADRGPISLVCFVFALTIGWGLLAGGRSYSQETVRFATFNVSLYGKRSGEVLSQLESGTDPRAARLAEIIQRARPDVLLLNEIDYDPDGAVLRTFCEKYLAVPQNNLKLSGPPAEAIHFPHRYSAPVNTGRASGHDLDGNGVVAAEAANEKYAGDCWGYGVYPGQYAMAILSKHPIDAAAVRTFQNFKWKDMPGGLLPDRSETPAAADWYSSDALAEFPLSSKSHWDVPILIGDKRVHVLASHPTPPVFDGEEDRNGRRNRDEIRLWVDYVSPQNSPAPSPQRGGSGRGDDAGTRDATPPLAPPHRGEGNGEYLYDDAGQRGGLAAGESFVILGDLNGDPHDGDGSQGIAALLAAPRVLKYPPPQSNGAAEQARLQGGANARHRGDPGQDTCDPADDPGPGNLRIDYVLPSADLAVKASGVFWPELTDPHFPLTGVHPFPSSDHRLVWVDVAL